MLVTGANGFVGTALCAALTAAGYDIRRVVRHRGSRDSDAIEAGSFGPRTEWEKLLTGVDCVVHLAARTHHVSDRGLAGLEMYRAANVEPTIGLARAAVRCRVRRLIYLSSIKVNGEATLTPYTEHDVPQPQDSYGVTKWEAERALTDVTNGSSLEHVILRPPLVYGAGVKGNYLRLMNWAAKGRPLPIGSIQNRRSMVYVGNLAHAIVTCIDAREAANQLFLVSDNEVISTPDLVRENADALGATARIYPIPVELIRLAARLIRREPEFTRIAGSLVVRNDLIKSELRWAPPFTCKQGIYATAQWYLSNPAPAGTTS